VAHAITVPSSAPVDRSIPSLSSRATTQDAKSCNQLADFMSQDTSYLAFRSFTSLNIRNLLWMQLEISELEKQYNTLHNGSHAGNCETAQSIALKRLVEEKLQTYSKISTLFILSSLGVND
jgi:hypothetical protein